MKNLLLLLLASFILMTGKAQKVDLKLNLEKGKDYRQVFNSKVKVIQEFNGQKIEMLMDISGTMTYTVISFNETGYDMESKYEKLSMKMNLPQGTMEYNSEIENVNDIMSTFLNKMTNVPFEFVISKTGKVLEVKKMDELWKSVLSQFDQLTDAQKEQVLAQVNSAYGDKAFKGNLEMSTAIYPEFPVNLGDKWNVSTNMESTVAANMATEYSFEELTPEYALIKGNTIITPLNKDEYKESNGMLMKYDLSGTMLSDIKVDVSSGWVIESKINQEIKGIVSVKDSGMTILMTMFNEMTITDK